MVTVRPPPLEAPPDGPAITTNILGGQNGPAGRRSTTRRDMVKLGAGGAGMFALAASGLAVPKAFTAEGVAQTGGVRRV